MHLITNIFSNNLDMSMLIRILIKTFNKNCRFIDGVDKSLLKFNKNLD